MSMQGDAWEQVHEVGPFRPFKGVPVNGCFPNLS